MKTYQDPNPTLTLTLRETNPDFVPRFVEDNNCAVNMDESQADYEIEVEIVQLNLNSGGMRVRYQWPSKHTKSGFETRSRDVSINEFFKHYEIKEKVADKVKWAGARDRNGGI
jgi:hypothetical protein